MSSKPPELVLGRGGAPECAGRLESDDIAPGFSGALRKCVKCKVCVRVRVCGGVVVVAAQGLSSVAEEVKELRDLIENNVAVNVYLF